jgi:Domain of unknown function DUF11
MRACVEDTTCRALYVEQVRQIGASPAAAALADTMRAIRSVIAPWRVQDPRREQTVADGEAQADAKIASMAARPLELAAWLAAPSFFDAVDRTGASGGGGGSAPNDLGVTGSVTPASAPVGGSQVWRLDVRNTGDGTALGVVLDLQLSPNVVVGFSQSTHGSGCVAAPGGLRCTLDRLGPASAASSTAEVVIGTNVLAAGEVSLQAAVSFAEPDPTPADDTLVLEATATALPQRPLTPPSAVRPLLGKPVVTPAKPVAGNRFTFVLPVARSDNGAPLLRGSMVCTPSVAGTVLRHSESFTSGTARLSFVLPRSARGRVLHVGVKITVSGRSASRT